MSPTFKLPSYSDTLPPQLSNWNKNFLLELEFNPTPSTPNSTMYPSKVLFNAVTSYSAL